MYTNGFCRPSGSSGRCAFAVHLVAGAVGQAQHFFNTAEPLGRESDFSQTMHLGLDDINLETEPLRELWVRP